MTGSLLGRSGMRPDVTDACVRRDCCAPVESRTSIKLAVDRPYLKRRRQGGCSDGNHFAKSKAFSG
jgi:hypothetical protein